MLAADINVFFGAEFARMFTRRRTGEPDVYFAGIFGVADAEALDSYAISAQHELHYPTAAVTLKKGDTLIDSGGQGWPAGTVWLVRETPMRVNDGAESSVLLSRSTS